MIQTGIMGKWNGNFTTAYN